MEQTTDSDMQYSNFNQKEDCARIEIQDKYQHSQYVSANGLKHRVTATGN